jgi:hypothetical protein
MTSINPFSGYVAQGSQIERAQSADKTRQVRRTQDLSKNIALQDDQLEHQVESADAVAAIHDDQQPPPQQQQHPQKDPKDDKPSEEPPHLDVTA